MFAIVTTLPGATRSHPQNPSLPPGCRIGKREIVCSRGAAYHPSALASFRVRTERLLEPDHVGVGLPDRLDNLREFPVDTALTDVERHHVQPDRADAARRCRRSDGCGRGRRRAGPASNATTRLRRISATLPSAVGQPHRVAGHLRGVDPTHQGGYDDRRRDPIARVRHAPPRPADGLPRVRDRRPPPRAPSASAVSRPAPPLRPRTRRTAARGARGTSPPARRRARTGSTASTSPASSGGAASGRRRRARTACRRPSSRQRRFTHMSSPIASHSG